MAVLLAREVVDSDYFDLFDPVTQLPTRLLLQDRCRVALARARRDDAGVGVVVVTLTEPDVNDAARDTAMRRAAIAVISVLRGDDTVARYDDGTLVALCNDIKRDQDLDGIATRLQNVLRHRSASLRAFVVPSSLDSDAVLRAVESGESERHAS